MPSNAFTDHLLALLNDVDEFLDDQNQLLATLNPAPAPGSSWASGALNRAVIVMCVSAWEAYIEHVAIDAVNALRPPPGTPLGSWPSHYAIAQGLKDKLHTPDVKNVKELIVNATGLADIASSWTWGTTTAEQAKGKFEKAYNLRSRIVHGKSPLPVVTTAEATDYRHFFENLGSATDAAISAHIAAAFGLAPPW